MSLKTSPPRTVSGTSSNSTVEFLRQFRDSWKIGARTAVKKIERVRAFFRFAVESGWIEKNHAKLVRGAATIKDTQKLPFDPKEMERIVEGCRHDVGVASRAAGLSKVI